MSIYEILMELQVNVGTKGFEYWNYAIIQNIINKKDLTKIYKELAKKEHTTWQYIQRAMDYSIKESEEKIRTRYNYLGKITNKVLFNLIINEFKERR